MGAEKSELAPKTNVTGEPSDNTTNGGAVDANDSDNAGGVSVTAAKNQSSALANGGTVPIDKSIAAAAEREMAVSAHSAIMSAAESEPVPVGKDHGA